MTPIYGKANETKSLNWDFLEHDQESLLPVNATSAEKIIEQASALDTKGIDIIRLTQRPYDIPLNMLPFLAWAFDVPPIWPTNEKEQRALVAESLLLHRTKGTAHCLKRTSTLAGAEVLKISTPPSKLFPSHSLTLEERKEFAKNHPELRWYPYQHKGEKAGVFIGDCLINTKTVKSDALIRIGDKICLYDPQSQQETTVSKRVVVKKAIDRLVETQEMVARFGKKLGLFIGDFISKSEENGRPGTSIICNQNAGARLFTLNLQIKQQTDSKIVGYEETSVLTAAAGLTPMTGKYELLQSTAPRKFKALLQKMILGTKTHPQQSTAGERLGRSLKLFDPSRVRLTGHQASIYLNTQRLTRVAPHHAYAHVEMGRKSPRQKQFANKTGYLLASSASKHINDIIHLMRWSLRASDRVFLRSDVYKPLAVSTASRVGSCKVGEYTLQIV